MSEINNFSSESRINESLVEQSKHIVRTEILYATNKIRNELLERIRALEQKVGREGKKTNSVFCQHCFYRCANETFQYCVYPDNIVVGNYGIDSRRPARTINTNHDCGWYKKRIGE